MNSRERVINALNHKEPDAIPIDLGGTVITGMHATTVYRLRQHLGLDKPGTPVKVADPGQLLGEIGDDLADFLGLDTVALMRPNNRYGFANDGWKEWTFFDGTPLLVPEKFNTDPEPNGDIYMYPQGDKSVPPSARMPHGGYFFDDINRQQPIDDDNLNYEDNCEEFVYISDDLVNYYKNRADELFNNTQKAIIGSFGGTSFGDAAQVPAPGLKYVKGIRNFEEWVMSLSLRDDYIYKVFERQCEVGIENLKRIYDAVGNKIQVVHITGADFGTQNAPFISANTYRNLFKPFHKQVNNWIHENTEWKTFMHSCGSIMPLIEDFIDAGFDILNPVQCSAVNMDPQTLKNNFGDRVTFWGGGVDTQKTLPFGTPEEVRNEVIERIKIFAPGGGFVFNTVHNVQACTPIENLIAMYNTFKEFKGYPIK